MYNLEKISNYKNTKKTILLIGDKGFLGSKIKKRYSKLFNFIIIQEYLPYSKRTIDYLKKIKKIDYILHLGTPSQATDKYSSFKYHQLLKSVEQLIKLSNTLKSCLIFASSEAIYDIKNYPYKKIKIESSKKIKKNKKENYKILILPRIYSSDKPKGLINKIKNNTFVFEDNFILDILDIEDFLNDFKNIFKSYKKIIRFKTTQLTYNDIINKYIN